MKNYRPCVAMLILRRGRVLVCERADHPGNWQVPQGGIEERETPQEALWRELREETGLTAFDVRILRVTENYLSYRIPPDYRRPEQKHIGQKQLWFLLGMLRSEGTINLNHSAEFRSWKWVSYWNVLARIVPFKQAVYRRALVEFLPNAVKMGI